MGQKSTMIETFQKYATKAFEDTSYATYMIMSGAGIGLAITGALALAAPYAGVDYTATDITEGALFLSGFCSLLMTPAAVIGQIAINLDPKKDQERLSKVFS